MKKYFFSTFAIAMIMTMAACSSSDNDVVENISDNKTVKMTFTAIQENSVGTRATLGGESGKQVIWEAGDKINVNGSEYILKEGVGTNKGTFEGYIQAGAQIYAAIYPNTDSHLTSSYDYEIKFPSEQSANAGTFDKKAAFMMAYSDNGKTTLDFKNAVALVKVTPKFACSKIELKDADNSVPLAGTGILSYNEGNPKINITGDKSYSITLTGTIEKDKIYYIAVPTVTLNAGWSISFTDVNDNVYTRTGSKKIEFTRNTIINLGEFSRADNNLKLTLTQNGNVPADKQVDMGVFNINGTNYRVIFTKSNLTATGLAEHEYEYGDYFAWGATSILYSAINKGTSPWTITPIDGKSGGYVIDNAPCYNGSSYTKYTTQGNTLEPADDAAKVILGGDWQIPTKEIWSALYKVNTNSVYWGPNNGDKTLETVGGIQGMKITKKDAPSTYLFLPAAGYVYGTSFDNVGTRGYYWSGTASSSPYAYYLPFHSSYVYTHGNYYRYAGFSVRPVRLVAVN